MLEYLNKYKLSGSFTFRSDETLYKKCNAPEDKGGVYLVYGSIKGVSELIYIGSSGKMQQDGTLKVRQGGMYDRLVDGKQFENPRRKSWPRKMKEENIESLEVRWYVTFDLDVKHIPGSVEGILLQEFFEINCCLPRWNIEF